MAITFDEGLCSIPAYPKADVYGAPEGVIILSSNENPYPPSKKVIASIFDGLSSLNRYPEGEGRVRLLIAERFAIEQDNIVLGNGSNEIIELVLKALRHRERGDVIVPHPSFPFYAIAARAHGYNVKACPLKGTKIDLDKVSELIDEKTRIIFLNNPHNPTGTILGKNEFVRFLEGLPEEILVVIDEAYAEFVESEDFPKAASYINTFPVFALRTFSKAFGLAGLRIGYGIGSKEVVSFLSRVRQPFSVNSLAIRAACAALEDEAHFERVVKSVIKGRRYLSRWLAELGIEFVKSEANFLLVKLGDEAERIQKELLNRNLAVRWMGAYGLGAYVRVTVGRAEENKVFIDTLRELLQR